VLAEFASVVDAVRCTVGIQEELKDRNKELPEGRRMEFRIGVNLGDVVEEGDNIWGMELMLLPGYKVWPKQEESPYPERPMIRSRIS